jgi:hypothetical protein
MLEPGWLNRRSVGTDKIMLKDSKGAVIQRYLNLKKSGKRRTPKFPMAIDPPHVDRRVAVQRSHFVLFGTRKNGLVELAKGRKEVKLLKIRITSSGIKKIRENLETCGISETTIFPDLEGLGRQVTEDWTG